VYERLVQNGKKAGFFQLLATQTISAVWHVSSFFFIYYFLPCFQLLLVMEEHTFVYINLIFSSTSNAIYRDCILDT